VPVHVTGPGYSQTHQSGQDGCVSISPQIAGEYNISADKACYETDGEKRLTVSAESAAAPAPENSTLGSIVTGLLNPPGKTTNATSGAAGEQPGPSGNAGTVQKSLPDRLSEMISGDDGTIRLLLIVVIVLAIILLLKNIVKN
jgi:hypothetical protein